MAEEKKQATSKKEVAETKEKTYIMKVTYLPWGKNGKNGFYAEKKPLISEKVMREYSRILQVWLKKGWIEEGKY